MLSLKKLHSSDILISVIFRYTPLHLACGRGHLEAGMALLRAGARWEILDKHERTPIDWAISGGVLYQYIYM